MNRMYQEDGHLTDLMLYSLKRGLLHQREKIEALSHISACNLCAQRFAEGLEAEELLPLPPQFAAGVEKKLAQIRITATPLSLTRKNEGDPLAGGKRTRDKQKEFKRYSCRVAIAACLALLLLFSGTFTAGMNAISKSRVLNPDLGAVNQLTQRLSDFSQNIIHWEDKRND